MEKLTTCAPTNARTATQIRDNLDGHPPAAGSGLFGVDCSPEQASLVVIPVPWSLSVSYGEGTEWAPEAVMRASHQLDYVDDTFGEPLAHGISLAAADATIAELNTRLRPEARRAIDMFTRRDTSRTHQHIMADLNAASVTVNASVEAAAAHWLARGKAVAVLGGDHSAPLGLIRALGRRYDNFSILHIDAHFDLRAEYEGFHYSHASVMDNVLREVPSVRRITHVGIRDFSTAERLRCENSEERCRVFYGRDLHKKKAAGTTWQSILQEIIGTLSERVYISFDIDGLDPSFCPTTGTPVPGGMTYDEGIDLIEAVSSSGRQVIGFDLCEIGAAPNSTQAEWDANVGARILYKLCGATLFMHR